MRRMPSLRRQRDRHPPRGFVSGGASLLAGRLASAALAWLGSLVVARSLSQEAWGAFSFVFGLLGLIGAMSDFQLGRSILRDLADETKDPSHVTGSYVVFRLMIGIAGYACATAFVLGAGYPLPVTTTTLVAGTVLLLGSMNAGLTMAFLSRRRSGSMAAGWTAAQAVQLAVILVDDMTGHRSVLAFAVPAVVYEVVLLGVQVALLRRRGLGVRPNFDTVAWKRWGKEALPLAIGSAMAVVYDKLDLVMLSKLSTLSEVGLYAIGTKFATLAAFAGYALAMPLSAELAESWPDDPARFRSCFVLASETLSVAAFGVVALFLPFAPHLITTLFGRRFAPASTAARLVVAASSVQILNTLLVTTLVALRRSRLYPFAALSGIVVNAGLNVVLIPRLGIAGAGIATLATEVGVLTILSLGLLRHRPIRGAIARATLFKCLLAALAAVALAEVSLALGSAWLLALATSTVAYFAVLQALHAGGPGGLADLTRRERLVSRAHPALQGSTSE
jgi:O-antigen/teichoic acid export membrane protein